MTQFRVLLIALMLVALLIAAGGAVLQRTTWTQIERHAGDAPTGVCRAPPAECGQPAGFCRLDVAQMDRTRLESMDWTRLSEEEEAWTLHVLEHGWSDAVALIAWNARERGARGRLREEAEQILTDHDLRRSVYAREAIGRADAGLVTRSRLVAAWRSIADDFDRYVARYGPSDADRSFYFSTLLNLNAAMARD